jgi:hypothetical protein
MIYITFWMVGAFYFKKYTHIRMTWDVCSMIGNINEDEGRLRIEGWLEVKRIKQNYSSDT